MGYRALVTGGSRGIGAATAIALGAEGHRVLVNYRERESAAQSVVERIQHAGGEADAIRFDVSDAVAVSRAFAALDLRGDPIQIVVNNAAVLRDGAFAGMSPQHWQTVLDTSLGGFYNVTRPLVLPMLRRRWGRIINVVSHSGLSGNRGQVNYSAAKAGLVGATKALAKELASRGITVNAVCPGLIDTDMLAGVDTPALLGRVAMGRMGRPDEVAAAVSFLCRDEAGYINGHVLTVDGGFEA
jgi:3-oxoacyl-[acyl-carrier protein] reductase